MLKHEPHLVVKPQGGVEVFSIGQHLFESFPAGIVVARGHKELLHLFKLVYSAKQAQHAAQLHSSFVVFMGSTA